MYPRNKTHNFLNDIIEEDLMEDENSVEISQKEKSDRKFLLSIDKIDRTDTTMREVNESVEEESISTILSNPITLP